MSLQLALSPSFLWLSNILYYAITTSLYVDGHLGCFHVLAFVHSATMILGVHASFKITVFSRSMPRPEMLGHIGVPLLVF